METISQPHYDQVTVRQLYVPVITNQLWTCDYKPTTAISCHRLISRIQICFSIWESNMCLCVCVCVHCICVQVCVRMHVWVRVRVCVRMCVHVHFVCASVWVNVYVCVGACMYYAYVYVGWVGGCLRACMFTHLRVYVRVCVHVHACVCSSVCVVLVFLPPQPLWDDVWRSRCKLSTPRFDISSRQRDHGGTTNYTYRNISGVYYNLHVCRKIFNNVFNSQANRHFLNNILSICICQEVFYIVFYV
jgi:hypothetical protein